MISQGILQANGETVVAQPELEGFAAEIQHTVATGRPYTPEQGLIGAGVIVMPTGQPRIVLRLKHPDGSSVSATLKAQDALLLIEILTETMDSAQAIADAAGRAAKRSN